MNKFIIAIIGICATNIGIWAKNENIPPKEENRIQTRELKVGVNLSLDFPYIENVWDLRRHESEETGIGGSVQAYLEFPIGKNFDLNTGLGLSYGLSKPRMSLTNVSSTPNYYVGKIRLLKLEVPITVWYNIPLSETIATSFGLGVNLTTGLNGTITGLRKEVGGMEVYGNRGILHRFIPEGTIGWKMIFSKKVEWGIKGNFGMIYAQRKGGIFYDKHVQEASARIFLGYIFGK